MNWFRDRLIPITIIGLLISMLLLTKHYKQNNAEYHQYNAHNSVSSALASVVEPPANQIPPKGSEKNRNEAIEKAVDRSLQRADNLAQVDMTLYALIGLIVGVLGIGLIGMTLLYTRDAAKAAADTLNIANKTLSETKEATRRELRSYIYIKPPKISHAINSDSPDILRLKFDFEAINSGQTPAYSVHITGKLAVYGKPHGTKESASFQIETFTQIHPENPVTKEVETSVNVVHLLGSDGKFKENSHLSLLVYLRYFDIYSVRNKEDRFSEAYSFGCELPIKQNHLDHRTVQEMEKKTV